MSQQAQPVAKERPKRRKWPWVLGAALVLIVIAFASCVICGSAKR
ncbi:hypothetical protein Actkin_05632 [Actinokineospora sp. UTMC 2448]|nr:hypothetical protein Actkin_05632 [Actinokineospora sp. UTMC 2448]